MNEQEALDRDLYMASIRGDYEGVKILVEAGARINSGGTIGNPLIIASNRGYLNIVKYLVERGADINFTYGGVTPLIEASKKGHFDIVKYLVDKGAHINEYDWDGLTALGHASARGYLNIVKYLAEHGALLDLGDINHKLPVDMAIEGSRVDIVKYLLSKGADYNHLRNNPMFKEILQNETNTMKRELTNAYLSLERTTPQMYGKSAVPKSLLLKMVYEKPYQEYCSNIGRGLPPLQLVALANILKLEYNIDISWINLCNRVEQVLKLLLG